MHFIFYDLTFGVWWKILGFSKSKRLLQNFWDGFCVFYLKTSCITFHLHYNNVSCILRCVFTLLQTCVLVGLDWVKPMMQLLLHVTCSCIPMHTYFLFNTFWYYFAAWDFSDCLFLPLSFLFALVCFYGTQMQIYLISKPSSFWGSTSSNPTHFSILFHDEKAKSDFFENFSRWGIHSERQVILSDLSDTDLPTVVHSRGWESLCDIPVTCPFVLI